MRIIYTVSFYLLLPFITIHLWFKGRRRGVSQHRMMERFGYFKYSGAPKSIWIHAVSVGEVLAAIPLIEALLKKHPEKTIVVTTMTPTGSARVQASFGDRVFHVYLPHDVPTAIGRFLKRVQPELLILIETELWPNLLAICRKKSIRILIANARLSDDSSRNYAKIKFFMRRILKNVSLVAAQTTLDRDRYIKIGLKPEYVQVAGNIKFDRPLDPALPEKARLLREVWSKRPVFIAGSTHAGEDELILDAFAKMRKEEPELVLILVPRHMERFNEVAHLVQKRGYRMARRSQPDSNHSAIDVFIGDTLGELMLFYAASDVAFVGGSWVNGGGHNLLEPAVLGIPCLTGPHIFNFKEIHRLLRDRGALIDVGDPNELCQAALHWLLHPQERRQAGEQGLQVVLENRGALAKHLDYIEELLASDPSSQPSSVSSQAQRGIS